MGPVIGLFLSRGPSSFFRRVDAVPSMIIISQNDAATTKDLWKRSLSLSLEASPWRKPLYRGQSDFEWPQVRTGLDPLHRLAFSFFFFFSAENPTKTSTLNQSTLSLSRCSPIYRVINLSAGIYLVENICNARASLFNELIAGNGRGDIFF